jgi:hypothetical protein
VSDSLAWFTTAAVAVVALFLLSSAIVVEWDRISWPWRRVLLAVCVEQAAITYGAVEAERYDVEPAARVLLLTLSIVVLVGTLLLLVVEHEIDRFTRRDDDEGPASRDRADVRSTGQ